MASRYTCALSSLCIYNKDEVRIYIARRNNANNIQMFNPLVTGNTSLCDRRIEPDEDLHVEKYLQDFLLILKPSLQN